VTQAQDRQHIEPESPADQFPTTQVTLLVRLVRSGDEQLQQAHRHIMAVYADPLAAYVATSRFRDLGEPVELVSGFFADRLGRETFLGSWLDSGQPLRLWLIGAFRNYCRERVRERARWRRNACRGSINERDERTAEHVFNQRAAIAVVRRALLMAEDDCEVNGLKDHWRVFTLRRLRDRSIREVATLTGISEQRVVVMERTAASHVREAIRGLLSWDGDDDANVEQEIQALKEALRP
jgi:DNA-directed RNA polymerase specialized sigma24 family protein